MDCYQKTMATIVKNRRFLIVLVFVTLCLALIGLIEFVHSGFIGIVIVKNDATQPIVNARIRICGQQFSVNDIRPKQAKTVSYKVRGESQYEVTVEFESGKKLGGKM